MQEFTRINEQQIILTQHYCPLSTTYQYSTFFTRSTEQILSHRSSSYSFSFSCVLVLIVVLCIIIIVGQSVGWLTEKWSLHMSSWSTSNTQTLLHNLYMQEFTRINEQQIILTQHYCPLSTTYQYSTFFTRSTEQILSHRSSSCCCSIHTIWVTGIEPHTYDMCMNQEFTNIIVPPCIRTNSSLAVLLAVDLML